MVTVIETCEIERRDFDWSACVIRIWRLGFLSWVFWVEFVELKFVRLKCVRLKCAMLSCVRLDFLELNIVRLDFEVLNFCEARI